MGRGDGAGDRMILIGAAGVCGALVAEDVGGGLLSDAEGDTVGAIAELVDCDGSTDGDGDGERVGSMLTDGSDDGSGAAARFGASECNADGESVGISDGCSELYALTPVGPSVGQSDGIADGASVGEVVAPPGDGDTIEGKGSAVLGVGVGLDVGLGVLVGTDVGLGEGANVDGLDGASVGLHTFGVVSLSVARIHSSRALEIEVTLSRSTHLVVGPMVGEGVGAGVVGLSELNAVGVCDGSADGLGICTASTGLPCQHRPSIPF